MSQSNSQQPSVSSAFSKDDAYQSLGIINSWIGNMDSKVSFALAMVGVLMGFIFSQGLPSALKVAAETQKMADLNGGEIIAVILVVLLYITSLGCIICLVMAIIARIKNTNNAPSVFSLDQ